jgi:hypothetical protein
MSKGTKVVHRSTHSDKHTAVPVGSFESNARRDRNELPFSSPDNEGFDGSHDFGGEQASWPVPDGDFNRENNNQ